MKGVIFAAGLGTRLYPLTATCPKALVEVDGIPMLRRIIEKFKAAGIYDIVINVHHFPDAIETYLQKNAYFGIDIHISREEEYPLETGGGLLKIEQWLDGDEPVVIHNADILTDFPLKEMIDAHATADAVVTLLVSERKSSRQLLFDESALMRGWVNLTTGQVVPESLDASKYKQMAFGGVHVISPRPFYRHLNEWATHEVFSIMDFYKSVCHDMPIRAFTPRDEFGWHDIGTMEKLQVAEDYLRSK